MPLRGADFLKSWIEANLPQRQLKKLDAAALVRKLRAEAAGKGLSLVDMGLSEEVVEKYILDAIGH